MKKAAWLLLLLMVCLSTTAKQKKHKKKKNSANEIESISMRRTGCYGRCPAYIIEIKKDGMATYTAIRFTADSGVFKKNIGVKKVSEIFNQANTSRIDTCKNEYKALATDLPGLIFTIKYTNTTKTIDNANYGPPVLRQLADTMDGIAGKKVDETWHR